MFVGTINKGISLAGYFNNGLVTPRSLKARHDELAEEMLRRGYNHKSPLEQPEWTGQEGVVDSLGNLRELASRCPNCRMRMRQGGHQ